MRTAIIVQARMGSSRLPGKVMKELGRRTVLAEVLTRCRSVPGVDVVVCAMPDEASSAAIAQEARSAGAVAVLGPETDVLARYALAAREVSADVVMRVTSDCPLIDPSICAEVLALRAAQDNDYAANNLIRTFPHGLDCEAFTATALSRAAAEARDAYAREHVTPWLRVAPGLSRANLAAADPRWADERWTLDYPEDLAFMRAVFAELPAGPACTSAASVHAVLAAHPEFRAINASRRTPVPATAGGK